jgi:hypothetical protein
MTQSAAQIEPASIAPPIAFDITTAYEAMSHEIKLCVRVITAACMKRRGRVWQAACARHFQHASELQQKTPNFGPARARRSHRLRATLTGLAVP